MTELLKKHEYNPVMLDISCFEHHEYYFMETNIHKGFNHIISILTVNYHR
jgi:hypothetical protein